jgi:GAF domain-containing protein
MSAETQQASGRITQKTVIENGVRRVTEVLGIRKIRIPEAWRIANHNTAPDIYQVANEGSTVLNQAGEINEEIAKRYENWLRELDALFAQYERGPAPSVAGKGDLTDDKFTGGDGDMSFDDSALAEAVFRFINSRLEDLSRGAGGENEDVRAALWWWSNADGGVRIVAATTIRDAEALASVFRPGIGILGRVLVDGETENIADATLDSAWQSFANVPPRYRGMLCLPIVVHGRVAGVLAVDRARPEVFSDESLRFAHQIVSLVKLAALHTAAHGNVLSLPLPESEVNAL